MPLQAHEPSSGQSGIPVRRVQIGCLLLQRLLLHEFRQLTAALLFPSTGILQLKRRVLFLRMPSSAAILT